MNFCPNSNFEKIVTVLSILGQKLAFFGLFCSKKFNSVRLGYLVLKISKNTKNHTFLNSFKTSFKNIQKLWFSVISIYIYYIAWYKGVVNFLTFCQPISTQKTLKFSKKFMILSKNRKKRDFSEIYFWYGVHLLLNFSSKNRFSVFFVFFQCF